jgi:CDP-diacylglycerol--glycerol-3-phosphate 3-phosphatidyltransferase
MPSLYRLKPQFQQMLRPAARGLAGVGVSANAVTVAATAISVLLGVLLYHQADQTALFLLLPVWLFVRMAANAVDGMLARDYGEPTRLGAFLNESGDLVSDVALYAPFAQVAPFGWPGVATVLVLAVLVELAGLSGPLRRTPRRNDGPMGKSDRALVFGALGLWLGLAGTLPEWASWIMPALAAALAVTIVNRLRATRG